MWLKLTTDWLVSVALLLELTGVVGADWIDSVAMLLGLTADRLVSLVLW